MDLDAWDPDPEVMDFSSLWDKFRCLPGEVFSSWRNKRPCHSKIILPQDVKQAKEDESLILESHDVDCLIIAVRCLASSGFDTPKQAARSVVARCMNHVFGYRRYEDYCAKGLLVSRLFPEYLHDKQLLRSKLTFENLLAHPATKAIFRSSHCTLMSQALLITDNESGYTVIEEASLDEIMDRSEIKWDGTDPLGQAVSDRCLEWDWEANNGTAYALRYCALPLVIRVAFTPQQGHRRQFEEIQRFTLKTPQCDNATGVEYETETLYHLHVVVKLDPANPLHNPAEVRTYQVDGKMWSLVLPDRHHLEHVIRTDTEWSVGDPSFKFILFYVKWTSLPDFPVPPPYELVEYQPPTVLPGFLPLLSSEPRPGWDNDDGHTCEEEEQSEEKRQRTEENGRETKRRPEV